MEDFFWKLMRITQVFWGIVLGICAFLLMLAIIGGVLAFLLGLVLMLIGYSSPF